jgi:transposase InsO family protein
LKEYSHDNHKYILYCVDVFSRFTVGVFIPDKKAETIGHKVLEKWVSVFGVMDILHSDLGGEFINEDLTKLSEYLDVKQTSTAAYSPNMNGCNERNHAVVDRMMEKMLFQDPSMNHRHSAPAAGRPYAAQCPHEPVPS